MHNRFSNFGLMNGSIYGYISLSNIFDRVDRALTGQKFVLQVEPPALYVGVTSDLARSLRKVFNSNDLFTCRVISS